MDGLMMDYQLNVPAILRRADELYGDSEIASRLPGQELAPLHVRRLRVAHEEAHRRAPQARPRGRRPRRDVHVEPLAAPRGLHGRTGRRVRHAHPEPPPASRRQHVHRDARRATACSSSTRCCGRSPSSSSRRCNFEHVIAVGDGPSARRHDRLRGAARDADESGVLVPRPPREHRRRHVLHERHHRPAEGRPLLASRDRDPRADRAGRRLGFTADDVCLPVVPMFHANAWCFPFSCTMAGVKQVFPGPHLDPVSLLEDFAAAEGDAHRGRADDLDGDPPGARRDPGRTTSRRSDDDRRRRRATARDDRGVLRAPRPAHRPRLGHDRDELRSGRCPAHPARRPAWRPQEAYSRRAMQGFPIPFCRDPRAGRRGLRPVGRRDDGRARGARPVDRLGVLRVGGRRRPLDGRRLVQDRRRRHHPPATASSRCRTARRTS